MHSSLLRDLSIGALLVVVCFSESLAYSVLSHEAIIDAAWKDSIVPVLLRRFPHATPQELLQAQAYAYGGAIIQDLGYYPFGNQFFTDLTHYVRSGDFVLALLEESRDLNEYAFALGALSHYVADTSGHQLATNRAVAIMYPKLAREYGAIVPYEDKPSAHLKVEFGFDVDQVAEGNYAPKEYHDFVGFEVSKSLLERAFKKTYSLDMSTVFGRVDLTLGSYRHAVSKVIPRTTKVAWHLEKKEMKESQQTPVKLTYISNISNSDYRKEWGDEYQKPGFFARLKALIVRPLPKVGPLSGLGFHSPPHDRYRALLLAQQEGNLQLPNDNLDTGEATVPAGYKLADDTYAKLLEKTSGQAISDELRRELLWYYADLEKPFATKHNPKAWRELVRDLNTLKSMPVAFEQSK
jgi:hypothetical protein